HHRLRPTVFQPVGPTPSPCARRVNPGRATRHRSLAPRLISLLTVLRTGCATRASASLSVTEGSGGDGGRRPQTRPTDSLRDLPRFCGSGSTPSPRSVWVLAEQSWSR